MLDPFDLGPDPVTGDSLTDGQKCRRRLSNGPHTERDILFGLLATYEEKVGHDRFSTYVRGYLGMDMPTDVESPPYWEFRDESHDEPAFTVGQRSRAEQKTKGVMRA